MPFSPPLSTGNARRPLPSSTGGATANSQLAKARGDDDALHLPSTSPYRKRFGTWEAALLHFGFTPEQVSARLERPSDLHSSAADGYVSDGLPVAELAPADPSGLPLDGDQVDRVRAAYAALPRRSRYVLTVRLGLGVEPVTLKAAAKPLALHLDRIRQLQVLSVDALARAAAGEGRSRPEPGTLRDTVLETLKALSLAICQRARDLWLTL
jgi:hypothetical protein